MAVVTLALVGISKPSKVRWTKVPEAEREKIKTRLAVTKLSNLRRFDVYLATDNQVRIGYAPSGPLANSNCVVAIIKMGDDGFIRLTMQRDHLTKPFSRLI